MCKKINKASVIYLSLEIAHKKLRQQNSTQHAET